ncbi:hypothetical protein CYMTET_35529 [Cymbomonas tetramitiformis]|uniref:Uncharacterized protein n=1 Tax=Cymbomonas tetramitiformis TaxID=36881 RepID=A0AAE0F908_9CHLO|nr:hypothetical protein CYMTET_35529 [Cymbomonas tetramitiformis]
MLGVRGILLLACASCFTLSRAHTTDVCWIWSNNGQGITFYVGTWHQSTDTSQCDVYSKLNSKDEVESCDAGTSGCKFCPLLVTSTVGDAYLHEGVNFQLSDEASKWTCRGYCNQSYVNGNSITLGSDRLSWTSFYVDVPCGSGTWTIDAPEHYIYDPTPGGLDHYCTINGALFEGATPWPPPGTPVEITAVPPEGEKSSSSSSSSSAEAALGGTFGLAAVITVGALAVVLVGLFIGKRAWKRSTEAATGKEELMRRSSTKAASEGGASSSSEEGVRDSFLAHQESLANPLSSRPVFAQTPRKSAAHPEEVQLAEEMAPRSLEASRSPETPPSPRDAESPRLSYIMGEVGAKRPTVTYNPFFGQQGSRPQSTLLTQPPADSSPVEDASLVQMMEAADDALRKQTASRSPTGSSSSHGSQANPGMKKKDEAAIAAAGAPRQSVTAAGAPRQSPSSRQSGTEGTRRLIFRRPG